VQALFGIPQYTDNHSVAFSVASSELSSHWKH
jgi:hypothetical protein